MIIDLFISDMFSPSKKLNSVHLSNYIYLLAYAVSVSPEQTEIEKMNKLKATISALEIAVNICSNRTSILQLSKSMSDLRKLLQ